MIRRLEKMGAVLAVFYGMAMSNACAQGIEFNFSTTVDCIASHEKQGDAAHCIGQSATECLDKGVAAPALKQLCVFSEFEEWEKRLKAVYPALQQHLQDQDDEVLAWGWGRLSKADALQDLDDSWYPYVEAQCYFELSLWEGLADKNEVIWCQMKQTAKHVLLLESVIKDTCRHDHCQEEKYPKWPN